jgi:hypothetical protein
VQVAVGKYEASRVLKSEALGPFWDEVNRLRDAQMKTLFSTEDPKYIQAIKEIDKILNIQSQFEKTSR